MIVGSRSTEKGLITSKQLKYFYSLLHKHGLANTHVTDTIKAIPPSKPDMDVERRIFHEELLIIEPADVIFLDHQARATYAEYLSVPGGKRDPKSVIHRHKLDQHYTWLRMPDVVQAWEQNLLELLEAIRQRRSAE